MTQVKLRTDIYQFLDLILAENKKESNADKATILIELMGINMAATIGDSCALVAKYIPMML